mgnify:CR=1 FL=1
MGKLCILFISGTVIYYFSKLGTKTLLNEAFLSQSEQNWGTLGESFYSKDSIVVLGDVLHSYSSKTSDLSYSTQYLDSV